MAEKRKLEFFLLRYVPDAVKEEFVNIGIVMVEQATSSRGFADVRFTTDWKRVRCLDPEADIRFLTGLEADIRSHLMEMRNRDGRIKKIEDSFSNVVQLSGVKGCLTENPAQELQLLTRLYLKPRMAMPVEKQDLMPEVDIEYRHGKGRKYILGAMEDAFKKAGVWELLMRGVPVAAYTRPKDPFKFDFGYRVREDTEIKLFHAVSMNSGIDSAVAIASRFQKIQPEMGRISASTPKLTAVIETDLDRGKNEVAFALEMMEESGIRIAEVSDMPSLAEMARVEIGA